MSETATIAASAVDAEQPRRSLLRWPLYTAAFIAFIWLAGIAITLLIHHTRLQQKLTHRLESVFGRHVEVGNYEFSLWTGPTLVAESVTFSDDPRFGNEYFLHAGSVEVRLHWQSLFRGHMDLGTVTLQRPSLNLVRDAAGDWNVAEWLPRITNDSSFAKAAGAPGGSATPATASQPYVRFDRVLFNDGRINFKRVDEKIPFALTDVTGSVEPDAPGRWRIDLEAIPTRAAVPLQQPGTIHVAAQVGGTSSRFRPANLALTWQQGSVSDLLRLARGYDFGVRGDFAFAANAHAESDDWQVETTTRFRSIHRWDLSLRPDDPDFNVVAKFTVHPQAPGFEVEHATIEAPHSRAEAAAHISWDLAPFTSRAIDFATRGPNDIGAPSAPTTVEITQSQIDFRDVLGWIRAFHPEVPADTLLVGSATAAATVSAAPARLVAADVHMNGAELSGSALRAPAQISPVDFHFDRGAVSLAPVTATFGAPGNSLRIEASSKPTSRDNAGYRVSGSVEQVRDLVAAASSLGWHVSRGWDVTGPARIDLRWPAEGWPWQSQPAGTIDLGGESPAASSTGDVARDATLLAPFLNEPVRAIKAHVEVRPDYRRITLASADAFGARWTGTVERHDAVPGWEFALSADHLATADVDRWLNPRWRQSLLVRVLPFLGSGTPSASPEALHAEGRIAIDQLTVAPLVAHRVQGELKLNGREIELANATAQIASGNLSGALNATLAAVPSYHLNMNFSNVDLGDLSAVAPSLANQFDGPATGEIALASRGASRSDLAAALSCDGTFHATPLQLKNLNLDQTLRQAELRATPESFHDATAAFTCSDSSIDFTRLTLTNPTERIDAIGSIDFSRQLDLTLKTNAIPGATFQLTGPLASPSIKKIATPRP